MVNYSHFRLCKCVFDLQTWLEYSAQTHLQLCCALKVSPKTFNVIGHLVFIETTPMTWQGLQFKKQETITFNKLWIILIAHICMWLHGHTHIWFIYILIQVFGLKLSAKFLAGKALRKSQSLNLWTRTMILGNIPHMTAMLWWARWIWGCSSPRRQLAVSASAPWVPSPHVSGTQEPTCLAVFPSSCRNINVLEKSLLSLPSSLWSHMGLHRVELAVIPM